MKRLIAVQSADDILPTYRDAPIGRLLEYHNLKRPFEDYTTAQLLIGMCMDNRKRLRLPENFAFILRSGGANLRYSEFKVSFAIAVGGAQAIALIGHTQCGMVNLAAREQAFIEGLVTRAGWDEEAARAHFASFAPHFEIEDAIEFVLRETVRLRERYPRILVAPLIYRVEDNLLYQLPMP